MGSRLLLLVDIGLFAIPSVFSANFLKRPFDKQKQDLLQSLLKIPKTEGSSRITLQIDAEGTISMDGQPTTTEEPAPKLETLDPTSVASYTALETTGKTPKSLISQALDTCANAGARDVLATNRPSVDAP